MATRARFRGRKAAVIENQYLHVVVLEGGGHIAAIVDKATGVNPLWSPPWPSIDPSDYDAARHPEYGTGAEAKLLSGIMGHNICLDFFGGPSAEEEAAGLTVHGEAPVATFALEGDDRELTTRADLPLAQLRFERRLTLDGYAVRIRETVENLASSDRPIGWTQHATLGPPFLEKGVTECRASATRSQVFPVDFGDHPYLETGAFFDWPHAPQKDGGSTDLRTFTDRPASCGFTTHLMDPAREHAFFVAFSPRLRFAFGYVWKRTDFPWLGIWEENLSRKAPPWNSGTLTRGMEFSASPFPETRRQMIDRGRLFDTPGFRWIPARSTVEVEYWAIAKGTDHIPEELEPTS